MAEDDVFTDSTDSSNDPIPDSGMQGEPGAGRDSNLLMPGNRLAFSFGPSIPHYYGDYVRSVFVLTAGAMLILAPFLADKFTGILPFQIGGALTLACLAGLTNPRKPWVLLADALAAAVGILVFEFLALIAFGESAIFIFMFLEGLVLMFLIGLYFSIKTYRAMTLGQIPPFRNS